MKSCSLIDKIKGYNYIDIHKLEELIKCTIVKTEYTKNTNDLPQTNNSINRYILYFTRDSQGFKLAMIELEHNRIGST
jgi:hypothetical protein